jgi:hypothetical protein
VRTPEGCSKESSSPENALVYVPFGAARGACRGLSMKGSAHAVGGRRTHGVVNIRNCKIYGFTNGVGIYFQPGSSGGTLIVDNVLISGGYVGIGQYSHVGVSNMTVRNSNINNNGNGIVVQGTGGTHAGATIEQTTLAFNG